MQTFRRNRGRRSLQGVRLQAGARGIRLLEPPAQIVQLGGDIFEEPFEDNPGQLAVPHETPSRSRS